MQTPRPARSTCSPSLNKSSLMPSSRKTSNLRIHPSKSPMAAPVFFVKKKDGKLHLVQDYHALNAMTMKNKYPLPLIPELFAKLQGVKYFTKLDIRWGFNNVRIKEGDEWKAMFLTNQGLFKPLIM